MNLELLKKEALILLRQLIAIPSFSREETAAANLLESWLSNKGLTVNRKGNNLWVQSPYAANGKKVILLNSHIDTVKPASGYSHDPFSATIEDGKLYGLGSNDAGGALISLLTAFLFLTQKPQPYHLIFAATAEEEVSGQNGVESILAELGPIDFGIVGEPTKMQMAVAEKGLMVLDCTSSGVSGHAARNEGVNAIYEAIKEIEWFRTYRFQRESSLLGPVKMSVTQINAGTQHNVVPDCCRFVVDIRFNECYRNTDVLDEIKKHIVCRVEPRSLRINSSSTPLNHPFVIKGTALGISHYGSPTTSDQALMPFTTIKMGPGDSARSHTANEFIYLDELAEAPDIYIRLLDQMTI